MKKYWLPILSRLLVYLYYHRVRAVNAYTVTGPVLYVGLHRNGAVDGYVYNCVRPHIIFLISEQLRRSFIGRIFFSGIEVTRDKDRSEGEKPGNNTAAIEACVAYLHGGGELLIMPEGTSDLGHRHLPFQKGAARILAQAMEDQKITVVPVGIHYESAPSWQSDVEVVFGIPISTDLPAEISSAARIHLLHQRIIEALEALAVQAESPEQFSGLERMAYAATLGSERSYFSALKALESGMPEAEAIKLKLDELMRNTKKRLWLHQGIPLMPVLHAWAYPLVCVLLTPLLLVACVLNALPLGCAWWAGKRFSDERNTIALWRLLVGFPTLLIWIAVLFVIALLTQNMVLWFAYLAISASGLKLLRRGTKVAISVHNWAMAPSLRKRLLEWRASLEVAMRGQNV